MKNKKNLIFMVIGAITLIAVTLGATYAYFTAQSGGTGNINVNANTGTTDNLSFQVGEAISLTANQEDFGSGMGNKSGSTYARAVLTANNTTNTATRNYYVYLNILNNDFEYTTVDEQAEILLKVTNPDGTEVTDILGLTRKTSGTGENEVTGFDITTKTGSIIIADNYEITSTGTEEQEWQVEVIFVNLDSDQNANTNKTFNANLIIRENAPIGITEVSTSNITSNSITLTVNATSENEITNYYFAKDEEEYVSSASNTYTFTGLDAATSYTLKACVVDEEGYQSAVYSTEAITSDPTLADVCPSGGNLASCIQTYYTTYGEGTGGLYYHDGVGSYTNADQEAGDNSYRYSGANPNNYVCFGATGADCQNEENQYRIIGVFDNQIKLLKMTSYGNYTWSGDGSNGESWNNSTLNTSILNNLFYNNFSILWQNKIETSTWYIRGNTVTSETVKNFYSSELAGETYIAKIGLMYGSDYGYATSPENWTTELRNYHTAAKNSNWMFIGEFEWTIDTISPYHRSAFAIYSIGNVGGRNLIESSEVRPTFYLNSDVTYVSGTGTQTDPYRIA